jgi:hypothetical protein
LKRKKNLAKEIFYVWGRFPHVVVSLQVQMKVGKFIWPDERKEDD